MDCSKIGSLLLELRKEKNMTQAQVAEKLNVSDKTISKWERGLGCPDVSLLKEVSKLYDINIEKLLSGELKPNKRCIGKIRNTNIYVCPSCNNIITTTTKCDINCCGRNMQILELKDIAHNHVASIEEIENEYYISIDHDMRKEHYISFIISVSYDRLLLVKLYPEQECSTRIPRMYGEIYGYCVRDGLFKIK